MYVHPLMLPNFILPLELTQALKSSLQLQILYSSSLGGPPLDLHC